MHLVIDGIIFRSQINGGISRIFDNILPRMCDLDPALRITLFSKKKTLREIPRHRKIYHLTLEEIEKYMRPWRLWHNIFSEIHKQYLRFVCGSTKGKIWFSTYYTVPPFRWRGFQVVFAYDFIYEIYPSLFADSVKTIRNKKESISKADAVMCISHTTAQDLATYYQVPEHKIFVAELGYDDNFRQRTVAESGKKVDFPFILYLGKRKYYKGFDTLLSAFSQWEQRNEIKLVVVGPWWSDEEKDIIEKNNLQGHLILLDGVDDNQLCDLYNQAQAFVYPSLYEGFGIPLLEAMACGCPIVASRIPSTLEVAQEIPFYFEPGNVAGLVNALDEAFLAGTESERVNQGLARVKQYSWDQTARKVLNVMHHVAGTR